MKIECTREIYAETTSNVKEAKLNTTKTSLQRYLLRKYDVLEVAGIENLKPQRRRIIYYCTVDELYPLIKSV
jgi:hypothetical protein